MFFILSSVFHLYGARILLLCIFFGEELKQHVNMVKIPFHLSKHTNAHTRIPFELNNNRKKQLLRTHVCSKANVKHPTGFAIGCSSFEMNQRKIHNKISTTKQNKMNKKKYTYTRRYCKK